MLELNNHFAPYFISILSMIFFIVIMTMILFNLGIIFIKFLVKLYSYIYNLYFYLFRLKKQNIHYHRELVLEYPKWYNQNYHLKFFKLRKCITISSYKYSKRIVDSF